MKTTKTVRKTAWKEEFLITAYDLAREGASNEGIAEAIGVGVTTFQGWMSARPVLRDAIRRARDRKEEKGSFSEFIFGQLSPRLRKKWRLLMEYQKEGSKAALKMAILLSDMGTRARQQLFLYALVKGNFNPTQAMQRVGVSLKTYKHWLEDPEFNELVQELEWHKGNFYESQLIKLVRQGDSAATIFVNRTYNRERGYNDKVEMRVKVEHGLDLDSLGLSLEVRREILEKLRVRKEEEEARALLGYTPDGGEIIEVGE